MEKLLGKMIRDSWKNTSDFSAAFCFSMTGQSALVEFSLSSFNSIAGGSHLSLGIPTNKLQSRNEKNLGNGEKKR